MLTVNQKGRMAQPLPFWRSRRRVINFMDYKLCRLKSAYKEMRLKLRTEWLFRIELGLSTIAFWTGFSLLFLNSISPPFALFDRILPGIDSIKLYGFCMVMVAVVQAYGGLFNRSCINVRAAPVIYGKFTL